MSYLVIFLYSFSKHYHVFLSKISRKIYQFLIYVKDNIPVEKLGYTNVWFAIKDPWKVLLGNFFVFIFHFPIFKIFQSSTMSQNFRIWQILTVKQWLFKYLLKLSALFMFDEEVSRPILLSITIAEFQSFINFMQTGFLCKNWLTSKKVIVIPIFGLNLQK